MRCRIYCLLVLIVTELKFVCCEKLISLQTVERESLKVKIGTHKCVSDCSQVSLEGNDRMQCSVEVCGVLETTGNSLRAPKIARKKVFFEKYADELEERNRLALHIEWSSADNASLAQTKGYLVNISDGVSSYARCYNFATSMKFTGDDLGMFYNDCFGKVSGTRVRLGSTITVHITTLPTSSEDASGTVSMVIEVPDCTNERLHSFEECQTEGGRPTSLPCSDVCNTTSAVNGMVHPVTCTLSKDPKGVLTPGQCDEVNRTASGTPSPPKHILKTQEWYKYIDPDTGDVKIALNFSWMPKDDSSLPDLQNYELEVIPINEAGPKYFYKCFAIHTQLILTRHHKAEFFSDCYGRTWHSKVKPGETYRVFLNSLPAGGDKERTTFDIKIPRCSDRSMHDVTWCIEENSKVLNVSIDEIFCNNRSLKVSYHVTSHFGNLADVVLCQRGPHIRVCDSIIDQHENIMPSGTIYNASLPSSANLSLPYVVIVHGTDVSRYRTWKPVNFSGCVPHKRKTSDSLSLVVGFSVIAFVFLATSILYVILCREDCSLKQWMRRRAEHMPVQGQNQELMPFSKQEQLLMPHTEELPLTAKPVRVYVVFADDCELHLNVVHWFCSFLKRDLGIDVRSSIWDKEEVAINSIQYMENNLRNADKVLVICSRGMRNCFSETDYDGNVYTPVIKKICQQAFIGQSPGKYLVGYFPYSSREDVPELLLEQCMMCFALFKLMKQFEQLYFRLIGAEQYQEGHIRRIDKIAFDRYHERELTECGMDLKLSIERMEAHVRDYPTWYNDMHGADVPQASIQNVLRQAPSLHVHTSITDPASGRASIARIHAEPPPELTYSNPAVQRPVGDALPRFVQRAPLSSRFDHPAAAPHGDYHQLLSTVSSGDSSYMVPETELEDLSSGSSIAPKSSFKAESGYCHRYPLRKKMPLESYHPGLFTEADFEGTDFDGGIDSTVLTDLPSDMTQMTRVGLSDPIDGLSGESQQHLIMPIIQPVENLDVNENCPMISLATIEEGVLSIEEQFKSINFS